MERDGGCDVRRDARRADHSELIRLTPSGSHGLGRGLPGGLRNNSIAFEQPGVACLARRQTLEESPTFVRQRDMARLPALALPDDDGSGLWIRRIG